MSAVTGTRRGIKELVDGTIRVSVDIDPEFRKTFFASFSEIDMKVALAPMVPESQQQPEPKEKPGPLCRLAVQWCQDERFQEWAYNQNAHDQNEAGAKQFICETCGIESRKELDTNPEAADKFHRLIRIPYSKYLEGK